MNRAFMRKAVCFSVSIFMAVILANTAFAVKPPSSDVRVKAEKTHVKQNKEKAREECKGGCRYGKDKVTGKCYQPKEGQFYRDCSTGEVKVMKIEKINTPWGSDAKASPSKKADKKSEKKSQKKDSKSDASKKSESKNK